MSTRAWTHDIPYARDSHYIYDEIHLIWSLWTYLYFELMSNCKLRLRRDWRYQKGNQNPYIEEEQTKVQKDKQRSTQHTHKSKDRVTRTPLKTGGELRCSTSGTRRVNLVTSLVISHSYCSMWYTCMTNWNVYSNCLFLLVTFIFFWPVNFQGVEICILCFSKLHQIVYCVFVCLFV
jgi:hypothetical protein